MFVSATVGARSLLLAVCLSTSSAFTPSMVLKPRMATSAGCRMMADGFPRRDILKFGGALLLGGAAGSPAFARSFEEFMAEKKREEQMEAMRKAGIPQFPEVEQSDEADVPADTASTTEAKPSRSAMDDYKDLKPVVDEDPLKTNLVRVFRLQEATLQQERLVRTGLFKDLQRNNIKLATRMMLENFGIRDAITQASSVAKNGKVSECNEIGRSAVEDLQTVLTYFDDNADLKLTELPEDKKQFIMKAFQSCRRKLDDFLSLMPVEKVAAARAQVIEENRLNQLELPKDMQILNPVFMQ